MAPNAEDDIVRPSIEDDDFEEQFDRDHRNYSRRYEENGRALGLHRRQPVEINEEENEAAENEAESEIAEFIKLEHSLTPEAPNLISRNERIRPEDTLPKYESHGSM